MPANTLGVAVLGVDGVIDAGPVARGVPVSEVVVGVGAGACPGVVDAVVTDAGVTDAGAAFVEPPKRFEKKPPIGLDRLGRGREILIKRVDVLRMGVRDKRIIFHLQKMRCNDVRKINRFKK